MVVAPRSPLHAVDTAPRQVAAAPSERGELALVLALFVAHALLAVAFGAVAVPSAPVAGYATAVALLSGRELARHVLPRASRPRAPRGVRARA